MTQQSGIEAVLAAYGRGDADLYDLAEALTDVDHVSAFVPPGEMARYMQDLSAATDDKGFGNVLTSDATAPRMYGRELADGGFWLSLFLDDDHARELVVTEGLIEPDGNAPFMSKGFDGWLWDVMGEEHAGVILDQGTDHELQLPTHSCARVYALLNMHAFAHLPEVFPLCSRGQAVITRDAEGENQLATIYSDARFAEWVQNHSTLPEATTPAMPTVEVLQALLDAGVTAVLVDQALPFERAYVRQDLVQMLQMLDGGAADIEQPQALAPPPGDPHAATGTVTTAGPEPDTSAAVTRANRFPTLPPVRPPGRPDEESHRVFRDMQEKLQAKKIQVWDYSDYLAYGLDLYIPVHHERVDGLRWPSVFSHPEDDKKVITHSFYAEKIARQLTEDGAAGNEYFHLAGIEALRWAWAAPKGIDEVAINLYPGTTGWVTVPTYWVLSAVYPHFHDIDELEDVEAIGLSKLGRVVGARGSQPQVTRALLRGWNQLVMVKGDGKKPPSVAHRGGRYLPVFSSADSYFEFDTADCGVLTAAPRSEEPPFAGWLRDCAALDGVILDPGGDRPVALDHTDLVVLSSWIEQSERRPTGTDILREASRQYESLSPTLTGRIVADWPRYFVCVQQLDDGGAGVMTLPDQDCCAVFSDHARADFYLQAYRQAGVIDGSWKAVPMLAHWERSVFHELARNYDEGGWIDPMPPAGGMGIMAAAVNGESDYEYDPRMVMDEYPGIHVEGEVLESALRRIDEKLKPRIPGFVLDEHRSAA